MLWRTIRTTDVMMHSSSFLLPKLHHPANKPVMNYALVVLNQQLPRFMPRLWDHANLRICADGGANRIFDEMFQMTNDEDKKSTRNRYVPEIIEGDMDSIRPEVKLFYSNQGSKISDKSHNQETTDLHKCISRIHLRTPDHQKPNLCVLVTGALGGRFDHEAANINVLYLFSDMRIVLLSDDCLIRLLPKTHHHELYIESSVEGPHCGLFPVGAPSTSTTTTGLKWNLSESKMRFGSMISTSNIVQSEKMNTASWRFLVPQLYRKYPDDSMILNISANSPPSVRINVGTIDATVELDVTIYVLDFGKIAPVACMSVSVAVSGAAAVTGNNLGGRVDLDYFSFTLKWSKVGKLHTVLVQTVLRIFLKDLFVPYVNSYLEQGFQFPSSRGSPSEMHISSLLTQK